MLTSSQRALTLCANVLLDAGDRIFIEDLGSITAHAKPSDAGGLECDAPAAGCGRHAGGLTASRSLPAAGAVFLTPSHQFPTGRHAGAGTPGW